MDKDNKKRLMLMKEVLEKYSDEDHPLTTAQIIEILDKEYGMKIHRTTVSRDIADQSHNLSTKLFRGAAMMAQVTFDFLSK